MEKDGSNLAISSWISEPGIPVNCPIIESERFKRVDEFVRHIVNGGLIGKDVTRKWTAEEKLYFIRSLPNDLGMADMKKLDYASDFSDSDNSEIQVRDIETG